MTSGDSTEPRIFTNQVVRLHELADEFGNLSNVLVTGCEVFGPGVIAWNETQFTECSFKGHDYEGLIWPISDDRRVVTGAFVLRNSHFADCTFSSVGVVVKEQDLEKFLNAPTL